MLPQPDKQSHVLIEILGGWEPLSALWQHLFYLGVYSVDGSEVECAVGVFTRWYLHMTNLLLFG